MRSGEDIDFVIDLESSTKVTIVNDSDSGDCKKVLNKLCGGFIVCDGYNRGEGSISFENGFDKCAELENGESVVVEKKIGRIEKVMRSDKPKKKGCKKPPKPPRPPRQLSADLADQKLIREISELAMLKRARVERMRALKKTRNGKAPSAFAGNSFALIITLIFCIVIFWQGVFSRGSLTTVSRGSPLSMETATRSSSFISIQFYNSASANTGLRPASPRNVGFESVRGQQFVE